MDRYEVYLHIGLLEAVPKRGVQRKLILDFISGLRDHPRTEGDYSDKDASLRIRQIKIVGDYAITYWLDDPVKSVMIVDVRPADRQILLSPKLHLGMPSSSKLSFVNEGARPAPSGPSLALCR